MAANGPTVPEFSINNVGNGITIVLKTQPPLTNTEWVYVLKIDFDTIYTVSGQTDFTLFNVKTTSILLHICSKI
jgi:hypothetical protein